MKNFVVFLLGVLVASGVSAQSKVKFNPALSQDQIAISAGLYQAISGDELNEGINYGVDWLHNFTPAFGVRGGVAFVENLADNIHLARLPLGVAPTAAPKSKVSAQENHPGMSCLPAGIGCALMWVTQLSVRRFAHSSDTVPP